jgi:hypothetical protein
LNLKKPGHSGQGISDFVFPAVSDNAVDQAEMANFGPFGGDLNKLAGEIRTGFIPSFQHPSMVRRIKPGCKREPDSRRNSAGFPSSFGIEAASSG